MKRRRIAEDRQAFMGVSRWPKLVVCVLENSWPGNAGTIPDLATCRAVRHWSGWTWDYE